LLASHLMSITIQTLGSRGHAHVVNALFRWRTFSSGLGTKTPTHEDASSSLHSTMEELNTEISSLLGTGSDETSRDPFPQVESKASTRSSHQEFTELTASTASSNHHHLTHVDASGAARMVDVTGKGQTVRTATAIASVFLSPSAFQLVADNQISKGDVLTVAKLAGIMGAKHTSTLIPLCHPLLLTHSDVALKLDHAQSAIRIEVTAVTVGQTGVEMEAMTGAAVSALAVYDMCKAVDKSIEITGLRLLSKTGGKSGNWSINQKGDSHEG
jgi:cyclic pyranopterin phosphate synthase